MRYILYCSVVPIFRPSQPLLIFERIYLDSLLHAYAIKMNVSFTEGKGTGF